jgi:hypothetical protein
MKRSFIVIAAAGLWLGCLAQANGQRMTEMYIPIGQSPGVSGKTSLIGEIAAVDQGKKTLTVTAAAGSESVVLTDRTWIWLDRSQVQLPNTKGTLSHLRSGRKVEVRFHDADQKRVAEWVKVQVGE